MRAVLGERGLLLLGGSCRSSRSQSAALTVKETFTAHGASPTRRPARFGHQVQLSEGGQRGPAVTLRFSG